LRYLFYINSKYILIMADNISLAFATEFAARAETAFQDIQKLDGTTQEQMDVVGKFVQFVRVDKGVAVPHTRNSVLPNANLGTTVATAETTDYDFSQLIDPFDQAKVRWSMMDPYCKAIGYGLGRRRDQMKLDAIEAGATQTVAVDYGSTGTNTALNAEKINRARALLLKQGVPDAAGKWHAAISAEALEGALNDNKIGNYDFNVIKALYEGSMKEYAGFMFHVIADRAEGGLPTDANGYRKCYFWYEDAVGYGQNINEGMDGMCRIDWDTSYGAWRALGRLGGGAKVIEDEGVVEVLVDESKAAE